MVRAGRAFLASIPRDLAVLAVSVFIWGLGEGLFIYFYPLALQRWGSDPVVIGVILSMLGVVMALVQIPAGVLSDRFGTRPLIRAAMILGVVAAVIMALAQSMAVFLVGLVAYTLTSFIGAPINSYITSKRGSWSVQRAVTFISGAMQLGAIAGPILGGWIGQTAGMAMVFRYSAGLFFVSTLVVFFAKAPDVLEAHETAAPLASPFNNPRLIGLLLILFFTIIFMSMPQQLTSIYLQEVHHLTLQQVGTTGTLAGIGTAVIMFAFGNFRAPLGMLAGQVLLGIFSLFMWQGKSVAAFNTGYLFVGGYRMYHLMALAVIRPLVRASDVGLAYGLAETCNALAVILAPLAAGFLYHYQPEAVYIVSLLALAVMIVVHMIFLPKIQATPANS